MIFENAAPDFDRAINAEMPLIADSLLAIANRTRDEQNALAAVRGGSRDFGDEKSVRKHYTQERRDAAGRGMKGVERLREKLSAIADSSKAFDPTDVAALAPVLALDVLGDDDDFRILAKSVRGKRGALLAIARSGSGAYASTLAAALEGYDEAVQGSCRKAGIYAERALNGTNGIKSGDALSGHLDDLRDDISSAWDRLQSAIDGEAPANPLDPLVRRIAAKGGANHG